MIRAMRCARPTIEVRKIASGIMANELSWAAPRTARSIKHGVNWPKSFVKKDAIVKSALQKLARGPDMASESSIQADLDQMDQ